MPGYGFTAQESRLNVLFTRQRCGLVIVGDIHMDGIRGKGNAGGKAKAVKVETITGDTMMMKPTALLKMYRSLHHNNRVGSVVVRGQDDGKGGDEWKGPEKGGQNEGKKRDGKKPQGKEGVNA
ncbi:DNA helicase [Colletotrichum musicola]|uniref:DNA helicase n=1 Tax=Colletotrichum musicola TaxID=2175873 RepID=A0A8H6J6N7_9PEZI|nr:DNA helicase [Colletotrichum musicola]